MFGGGANLLGGGPKSEFIAAGLISTGGGAPVAISLSGRAVGQMMIVEVNSTVGSTAMSGTAWNSITIAGLASVIFWRQLDAGDFTHGSVDVNNGSSSGAIRWMVYSGPVAVALKAEAISSAGASTLTLTGFTEAETCCGIVALIGDTASGTPAWTPPAQAGLATRAADVINNIQSTVYDVLTPNDYSSTSLVWSGFNTAAAQYGRLLEMTR